MNRNTRQALEKVARILDEAGWMPQRVAQHDAAPNVSEETLAVLRGAYDRLLNCDYFAILHNTLEKRLPITEAGSLLGLDPDGSRRLFSDALNHLREFVATYQEQQPVN
jgi:hypothetical protein